MAYVHTLLAILAAFLCFRLVSSDSSRVFSEFNTSPANPILRENVSISCRFIAQDGFTFDRTEPWLAFDSQSQETYSPVRVEQGEVSGVDTRRFLVFRSPDPEYVNLSVTLVITNFSIADVGMKVACIGRIYLGSGNEYEKVLDSTILKLAVPPPAPTNLVVSLPTNTVITCHSPIFVTWDGVPTSMTNRTIEGYQVSFRGESGDNKWRVFSPSIRSGDIATKLDFSSRNKSIQARINCWSKAGHSSTVLSNELLLYHPEIQNLTVHNDRNRHMLHLEWIFASPRPGWLLDIGYKLDLSFSTANRTESFSTTFTLPSDTLRYTLSYLNRLPLENEITFVSLTQNRICHQKLKYLSKLNLFIDNPPDTIPTPPQTLETETLPPILETLPPILETLPPTLETSTPILETSPPTLETYPVVNNGSPNTNHSDPIKSQDPDVVKTWVNKLSFENSSLIYPSTLVFIFIIIICVICIICIISCVFVCCKKRKDRVGDRAPEVEGMEPEMDEGGLREEGPPPIIAPPNPINPDADIL